MKLYEAFAVMCAARDGSRWKLFRQEDIKAYQNRARVLLREVGMKDSELEEPCPRDLLQDVLHLIDHDRPELNRRAEEAQAWLIQRN